MGAIAGGAGMAGDEGGEAASVDRARLWAQIWGQSPLMDEDLFATHRRDGGWSLLCALSPVSEVYYRQAWEAGRKPDLSRCDM